MITCAHVQPETTLVLRFRARKTTTTTTTKARTRTAAGITPGVSVTHARRERLNASLLGGDTICITRAERRTGDSTR